VVLISFQNARKSFWAFWEASLANDWVSAVQQPRPDLHALEENDARKATPHCLGGVLPGVT